MATAPISGSDTARGGPAALDPSPTPRRSFLAAALGGAAALVATALGRPAPTRAAQGDAVLQGVNNLPGAFPTTVTAAPAGFGAIIGANGSSTGRGVHGKATATTGTNIGVYGSTASSGGRGVLGKATKTTGAGQGVRGEVVSPDGWGIYGKAATTAGSGAAIRADGGLNTGLHASTTSATRYAIRGTNSSTAIQARAIFGEITSTTPGGDSAGVTGWNRGTGGFGIGVSGFQDGSGWGVYGRTQTGYGVVGETGGPGKAGVWGFGSAAAGVATGVAGEARSGTAGSSGVFGSDYLGDLETNGVLGETHSTSGNGVKGVAGAASSNAFGVFGYATSSGRGVVGDSSTGVGVHAISLNGTALKVNGHTDFQKIAAQSNPASAFVRVYCRDNGTGKAQLVAHFPGGNIVVIGTSV